jgi:DMSO/TMAO reductase YedYZ molybdopterin-dependent catalytic subunit
MKISKKYILFIVLLAGFLFASCSSGSGIKWDLKITGDVGKPLDLKYDDLAKMPQTELKDVLMNKSVGEDQTDTWSGVKLDVLLNQANAAADFTTITALAADGYAIEITKDELKDAIIALTQNGTSIQKSDPEHGPIRLVCPQTPANRWVYQVTEIQVNK